MKSAADNQGFSEDWPPKPDEWMAGGRGREAWPAIPLVRSRPIRGFPVSALRETISHDLVPADSVENSPIVQQPDISRDAHSRSERRVAAGERVPHPPRPAALRLRACRRHQAPLAPAPTRPPRDSQSELPRGRLGASRRRASIRRLRSQSAVRRSRARARLLPHRAFPGEWCGQLPTGAFRPPGQ